MRKRFARHRQRLHLLGGGLVLLLGGNASLAQSSYRAIDLNHDEPYGTAILTLSGGRGAGFVIEGYGVLDETRYCRRAVDWISANSKPHRLNFLGSPCSDVRGMSGNRRVGGAIGFGKANYYSRAVLFDRVARKSSDLSAAGFEDSSANGIHGDEIVGQASGTATGGHVHSVLWNIGKSTVVDLNGTNHLESAALATNGKQQVGWASDDYGENVHATLWYGTQNSEIDLNPGSFDSSYGYAIDAGSQVGVGVTRDAAHALLWHGKAAGVVDLNPAGFVESYATAVSGNRQVGYAIKADLSGHALVWSGKASRYVDLQKFLPSDLTQSYATSVDASGHIGGYATEANGTPHAVIWWPIAARALPVAKLASTGR